MKPYAVMGERQRDTNAPDLATLLLARRRESRGTEDLAEPVFSCQDSRIGPSQHIVRGVINYGADET